MTKELIEIARKHGAANHFELKGEKYVLIGESQLAAYTEEVARGKAERRCSVSQFEKDYPSFISLLKIVVSLIWFISFAGGFFFGAMIIDAAFTGGAHIYVTGITK